MTHLQNKIYFFLRGDKITQKINFKDEICHFWTNFHHLPYNRISDWFFINIITNLRLIFINNSSFVIHIDDKTKRNTRLGVLL